MDRIYLDNGSTSFPKPDVVPKAIYDYMVNNGANINRGTYTSAQSGADMVFETRQLLCSLFGGSDPANVVFTKNITESLNIVLKGFLKPGDNVICSSMEHNAVMRPLVQLESKGITFTRVQCEGDGTLDISKLEAAISSNTKAVVMLNASNVCGSILPAKEVGDVCKKHDIKFILDAAQTAGVLPIDMASWNIDVLCFTGHKSLLGPQGVGGFILSDDMVSKIDPLLSGGTGSLSHTEEIPPFMPDRFEPGTINIPGIVGLRSALLWLKDKGIDNIRKHEVDLAMSFIEGLKPLEDSGLIRIVGTKDSNKRVGVVSIATLKKDAAEVAGKLDEEFGIQTRVGLHCAPSAHKTLGTYPSGTIRFSFGAFNTQSDVDAAINAIKKLV